MMKKKFLAYTFYPVNSNDGKVLKFVLRKGINNYLNSSFGRMDIRYFYYECISFIQNKYPDVEYGTPKTSIISNTIGYKSIKVKGDVPFYVLLGHRIFKNICFVQYEENLRDVSKRIYDSNRYYKFIANVNGLDPNCSLIRGQVLNVPDIPKMLEKVYVVGGMIGEEALEIVEKINNNRVDTSFRVISVSDIEEVPMDKYPLGTIFVDNGTKSGEIAIYVLTDDLSYKAKDTQLKNDTIHEDET